ncbi:cob(I)yrinic acid a,c-diamide adenosyltransferase [Pseudomonadota bacterium]
MNIYTKTGDSGETGLRYGQRISKSSLQINCIGEVDELNASLGLARSSNKDEIIEKVLGSLQNQLFDLGADLSQSKKSSKKIQSGHAEQVEHWIDQFNEKLEPLNNFVLPGGTEVAALLHLSRSVCRRAERKIVEFSEKDGKDLEDIIKFLNRLSDLFMMARYANNVEGVGEIIWEGE